MKFQLIISTLLLLFVYSCKNETGTQESSSSTDELGKISYKFAGSDEAQEYFKTGLLLLHNFEYEDAREEFLAAQKADSTMAMAYWGEAMTHNHPLWRQQAYDEGLAALEKFAKTKEERLSLIKDEKEREFYMGIEILYGEGEKKSRDKEYSNYLEKLYKKDRSNHEGAAFYALSCLGATSERKFESYEKGAMVAKGIIEENPDHPGALHYLIHSYDDPDHAPKALEAANRYSRVAADAAHALHMPSHIYVAVGMWDEVVSSNIASYDASVNRMIDKDLGSDARSYHAFHWLLYGYLQKGQFQKAEGIMEEMRSYVDSTSSSQTRNYLIAMKGSYLAETGNWSSPVKDFETKIKDLPKTEIAHFDYMEGYKAWLAKDKKTLTELVHKVGKDKAFASTLIGDSAPPMCAANTNRNQVNKRDVKIMEIVESQLKSLEVWETEKAEKWLKQAVGIEDSTSYMFGPPSIIHPSHELYGNWLMENNRFEESKVQFEKALERGPKRLHALLGVWTSCQKLGLDEEAQKIETILKEVLKDADPDVKEKYIKPVRLTVSENTIYPLPG